MYNVVHLAWQPVVKIAAVDCAEMKNVPVCREHGVQAYPTLIVSLMCEMLVTKLYKALLRIGAIHLSFHLICLSVPFVPIGSEEMAIKT